VGAWLAWGWTHSPTGAATTAAGKGGPFGGGAGKGGRGGRFAVDPNRAQPVTAVKARVGDVNIVQTALGTVVASRTATVRPRVDGLLQNIAFTDGQLVKPGQVLAEIDPAPFQVALDQAEGQLARDRAQLDNARLDLKRYQTLLAQDSVAGQTADQQAALVKQLEGTVKIDQAQVDNARLQLSYTRITAPIGGRLGLRQVDAGNMVRGSDANGIAVITQQSPIDVEFAVPQDRLPALQQRINDNATLPATALDRTRTRELAQGRFMALDNQVDTQTGTVKAKARFGNEGAKLFPSQFVNIRLQVDVIKNAVTVPVTALRHGAGGDYVYVLNPQARTVALTNVKRGEENAERVEITSGLSGGETVITEGADRLKDGAKVTLPGDHPRGQGAGGQGGGHGNWKGRQGGQGGGADAPGWDGADSAVCATARHRR